MSQSEQVAERKNLKDDHQADTQNVAVEVKPLENNRNAESTKIPSQAQDGTEKDIDNLGQAKTEESKDQNHKNKKQSRDRIQRKEHSSKSPEKKPKDEGQKSEQLIKSQIEENHAETLNVEPKENLKQNDTQDLSSKIDPKEVEKTDSKPQEVLVSNTDIQTSNVNSPLTNEDSTSKTDSNAKPDDDVGKRDSHSSQKKKEQEAKLNSQIISSFLNEIKVPAPFKLSSAHLDKKEGEGFKVIFAGLDDHKVEQNVTNIKSVTHLVSSVLAEVVCVYNESLNVLNEVKQENSELKTQIDSKDAAIKNFEEAQQQLKQEHSQLNAEHTDLKANLDALEKQKTALESRIDSIYELIDSRKKLTELEDKLQKLEKFAKDVHRKIKSDREFAKLVSKEIIDHVDDDESQMKKTSNEIEKILSSKKTLGDDKNKNHFQNLKKKISSSQLIHFSKSDIGLCEMSSCLNSILNNLTPIGSDDKWKIKELIPESEMKKVLSCFQIINSNLDFVLESKLKNKQSELVKVAIDSSESLEGTLYKPEVEKLNLELKKVAAEKIDFENKLKESTQKVDNLTASLNQLQSEHNKSIEEREKDRADLDRITKEKNVLVDGFAIIKKDSEEANKQISVLKAQMDKLHDEAKSQAAIYENKLSSLQSSLRKKDDELSRSQAKQNELEQRINDFESQIKQKGIKIQELEANLKRKEDNKNNPFQIEQPSSIRERSRTPNRSILISRDEKTDLNQSRRDILNDSYIDRKNELAQMIACFEKKRKEYEDYKRATDQKFSDRANELIQQEKKKDAEIIRLERTIQDLRAAQSTLFQPKKSSSQSLFVALLIAMIAMLLAFSKFCRFN